MPTQNWIRTSLKEKGFRLKDAAEALELPAPRITDILKGAREVQADEIVRLADILGMNPRSLLKSLELGEKTILPGDDNVSLPLQGCLMANGTLAPLPTDLGFDRVPPPPDVNSRDGLSCYMMGDTSMGSNVPLHSLVIAADPKIHFAPIVPGSLLLISLPKGRVALRLYEKDSHGKDWLTVTDDDSQPPWHFSLLSDLMPGSDLPDQETVYRPDDIAAVILWVHQRRAGHLAP